MAACGAYAYRMGRDVAPKAVVPILDENKPAELPTSPPMVVVEPAAENPVEKLAKKITKYILAKIKPMV
jgi:hypothetical protein